MKRGWYKVGRVLLRKYKTYSEYVEKQKEKLNRSISFLSGYDTKYRIVLRNRIKEEGIIEPDMNVLCLAARIGTEVKSFLDLGFFAIGLDLNPGKENKFVVHGDFHDIQFPTNSVDVAFTNSLDHVYYFDKIVSEIKRVLKPKGFLILEIESGGTPSGAYESASWENVDDVLDFFLVAGFKIIKKTDFSYPWLGHHITLRNMGEDYDGT